MYIYIYIYMQGGLQRTVRSATSYPWRNITTSSYLKILNITLNNYYTMIAILFLCAWPASERQLSQLMDFKRQGHEMPPSHG